MYDRFIFSDGTVIVPERVIRVCVFFLRKKQTNNKQNVNGKQIVLPLFFQGKQLACFHEAAIFCSSETEGSSP